MEKTFHQGNRKKLYESLVDGTIALVFSGHAPRKTSDEKYPFYANRNFLYLTGLEAENYILMAVKDRGEVRERLFILPPDAHAERWNGVRMKPEEVRAKSGVEEIRFLPEFDTCLHRELSSGRIHTAVLDLYKCEAEDEDTEAFRMSERMRRTYPFVKILDLTPQLWRQRTIKQPCEIEAIREAVKITRAGILAMMRASKPGMYEYQYKAEFDYALAQHGVLAPAFPSIISAGDNNFCIHYYAYTGQAKDGDMILNDVGAKYDNLFNDVSRGWPCNGRFSEKQRLLYTCAYNTSQHMFSIIRPGMPMADVDRLAREYNFTQLKAIGLCDRYEDVGKYIWHGGAHHVGYDVHDLVEAETVQPGMVFCVDIGIYCEEWGIGFRLEDNCLVTEDGCENLTASIPRSIEEIEAVMASR
ncbi:MAG: Xaa-Pro peptidase family protein [Lachnospiraceae bacterium]|nr:Xaa-Pro peptidase family protein [Lachnospiraceae bacterium]